MSTPAKGDGRQLAIGFAVVGRKSSELAKTKPQRDVADRTVGGIGVEQRAAHRLEPEAFNVLHGRYTEAGVEGAEQRARARPDRFGQVLEGE